MLLFEKPPCKGCEHEHLSKLSPYIWLTPAIDGEKRKVQFVRGENYPNPCYKCELAITYDKWLNYQSEISPTYLDFREGVEENQYPTTQGTKDDT